MQVKDWDPNNTTTQHICDAHVPHACLSKNLTRWITVIICTNNAGISLLPQYPEYHSQNSYIVELKRPHSAQPHILSILDARIIINLYFFQDKIPLLIIFIIRINILIIIMAPEQVVAHQ